MTSRPGMADGRAFGLAPYLPVEQVEDAIMAQNNIKSYEQYREFLYKKGAELMEKFRHQASKDVDAIDRGCGTLTRKST